jgi:two-component system, OmpR family, copper resistance phosphate regulon response regulator CusR
MRILVVSQDPGVRAFIARAFKAEGCATDDTAEHRNALSLAATHLYELAVVDLARDTRDSLRLLFRAHAQMPDTPIIVLSGVDTLAIRLQSFDLGASDYLSKPFSIEELLARARVHLHRNAAAETVLKAGPLTLDERAREVRTGDDVIPLADREFRVLRHLMTYAGQVVSRQRLLSAVWGYDFDPRSNVVDVCIKRLRQHLGPDAPIETVRNAGYRLAVGRPARTHAVGDEFPNLVRHAPGLTEVNPLGESSS